MTTPDTETTPDDDALVAQGRIYIQIAAGVLLLTSILTVVAYVIRLGTGQLPVQLVRIVLTAGLGYALIRGKRWARWLTVLLMLAGMYLVVPAFWVDGAFQSPKLPGTLLLLGLFVAYGVIGRGLLYSESVRAFFRAHRA